MIPENLVYKKLTLPETNNPSIVLVTGSSYRHTRFALRFQQAFSDDVIAWFQIRGKKIPQHSSKKSINNLIKDYIKKILVVTKFYIIFCVIKTSLYRIKNKKSINLRSIINVTNSRITKTQLLKSYRRNFKLSEKEVFNNELKYLEKYKFLEPEIVDDINGKEFISKIKLLDPYFFLTLGGPLYKKDILNSIRGICINQHAGCSPYMKGSKTIEWAFYKRNIDFIGTTIHITRSGADSGEILRRSQATIHVDDDIGTCFARVVALGTELMIEVVQDIINDKNIIIFEQPLKAGYTFLSNNMEPFIIESIQRDHENHWLSNEKNRLSNY